MFSRFSRISLSFISYVTAAATSSNSRRFYSTSSFDKPMRTSVSINSFDNGDALQILSRGSVSFPNESAVETSRKLFTRSQSTKKREGGCKYSFS